MLGQTSNPMLSQCEQGIQAKVPANMQTNFMKVVHAGLTIMYAPQTKDLLQKGIAASNDPAKEAAAGATRLISNLYQQSGKTLPIALVVPTAMIFAFEYLDLVAKAGKAQITPDMISTTTTAVSDALLPLLGVTKDKLASMAAAAKQQQPQGGASAPQAPAAPAPGGIIAGQQGA